jgi:hypothetical protein
MCAALPNQAEAVKAHALVGLNQLLLGGTPAGRAAGAALAQRLAPSPAFQKSENRTGLVVNLAGLLGQPAAATRVAGAGMSWTECKNVHEHT